MSIIKYSPEDINKLADRLSKLESDIKALKLEKKAHFTAIKEGALRILNADDKEVARFGKVSAGVYGVKINDADGNLLVNLYDPANFEIKKAVKIEPAWDGGWQQSGASGTSITRTHNLGYFPSSMQLFGGNVWGPPTIIWDESYYASMDISWCNVSQVNIFFLNNATHGLPPTYRIVLFK